MGSPHEDFQKTWAVMEDVKAPGKIAQLDAHCTMPWI